MGRTLGPFTDVSTARVDGAYEIYEGSDDEGRPVEILTLGAVSSKDPARRALLSDTVAWAHATRGPADAPILSADLNGEQPYVVTLRRTGFRGVERLMERMLAMGPATGPLHLHGGAHTGQIPVIHTDPRGVPMMPTPPIGSPAVPASPGMPYLTRPAAKRPGWLVPLVVSLVLVVLVGGGLTVYLGVFDQANGDPPLNAEPSTSTEPHDATPDLGNAPVIDTSLEQQFLPGTTAVVSPEESTTVKRPGWPFAFRVPGDMECEATADLVVRCEDDDFSVVVELKECPDTCPTGRRSEMLSAWAGSTEVMRIDDDTHYRESVGDVYEVELSRFFEPKQNSNRYSSTLQVIVAAEGPAAAPETVQTVVNEILTQSS